MLQRLNPTNPLRIAINAKTISAAPPPPYRFQPAQNVRVGTTSPSSLSDFSQSHTTPPQHSQPRSNPTPQFDVLWVFAFSEFVYQEAITTLNSRAYTNKISLFLFIVHMVAAIGLGDSLYYLRGMQSNTQFCLQRAWSISLGSAWFGSLFVLVIEALRIVARALNLLAGKDEFMFSCAHCFLNVIQSIFRYGDGWAFVQVP
ncbi:putative choline transporter [Rosa chinensis]|uniref:Choline transporter-like protein n=1 Tax=Rosa chinensis TaxID=74649 RepID=A0A2P6RH50_ROSCH|nr:putative choline transporter [Rosa chinensis]